MVRLLGVGAVFFLGFLMLGLLSFAFSCVHSLFYLRCCCVVRLLVLFCVLLWVFHQHHPRHNGHHRQAHHHGDHHHSVVVFIRKTVQLFTKEPSIFNGQRHDRTLSIESSTHVDGCWSYCVEDNDLPPYGDDNTVVFNVRRCDHNVYRRRTRVL